MSDKFQKPSGDCITDRMRQRKAEAKAASSFAASAGSVTTCKYWIVIDEENAPPRAMFRQQYEAENFRELNGGRIETFDMKVRY